ncbi:probable serine/threonine-protein kinase DDB_G0282963 [Stomoxys calcitrans]|uniref:MADF domain-containing protein n=1 Tax=Stomoxys calcitrans TaxID=35570 RepID=A0A1I8NY21_STOCA|nr:probable serine/threonine-protein kinase DDB_G0282963 [Stomoxys calcitrans]XP_013105360.1 probable serine/threonine-protein kinase DDB_G0282963 [Stomoxys calcitrans]XP_013105361.1 probable serine/threonine-protein kinase DDB_G0282963 [Stomoxys calcitrans]XP_013105362.1 probable serine/threonine-protein kinase DDB_G0282963 [Stomoxys calcitrans]XP_013105364.1 probable serine/threonine-protein kinase DDB_G0282963 [Stomoxys calcitrans]XP_059226265.1 probable serine/threonine-protein kinase DDB_
MPPKKDPNAHNNNNNSSSTTTTTNVVESSVNSNNSASSAAPNSNTNANSDSVASSNNIVSATTNNNGTTIVSVIMPDAGPEQRTIAFQSNAKLCRLVRKCPWMYDRTHHNYAKKHILDKSWCKIARECNDSVASCKERWRNIRAAFARSINIYKTHSGPNRVKPYYLHKELSFLVKPMMEGRDKNDDTHEASEISAKDEYTEGEEEEDDGEQDEEDDEQQAMIGDDDDDLPDDTADIKSAFEALNPDISIHHHKMIKKNGSQNNSHDYDAMSSSIFEPHTEFSTSDVEHDFHDTRFDDTMSQTTDMDRRASNNALNGIGNNIVGTKRPMHLDTETIDAKRFKLSQIPANASEPDIRFLEALLPDMALMNTRQKIVFKRKIYQTLEEVFENSNDFPNPEPQTHHPNNHNQRISTPLVHSNSNSSNNHSLNNTTTTTTMPGGAQVKQTVLTVNSSTARNLINNIANLNETELQKVNGFLQSTLRGLNTTSVSNSSALGNITANATRLTNGGATATVIPVSSAAARLLQSTPKITITKVTCPPPASLRNLALNKPPSPSTGTVSTTIHHPPGPVITSNVHSTTSSTMGNQQTTTMNSNTSNSAIANSSSSNNNNNNTSNSNNTSPWNQLLPIAIKDEIEDVDID